MEDNFYKEAIKEFMDRVRTQINSCKNGVEIIQEILKIQQDIVRRIYDKETAVRAQNEPREQMPKMVTMCAVRGGEQSDDLYGMDEKGMPYLWSDVWKTWIRL